MPQTFNITLHFSTSANEPDPAGLAQRLISRALSPWIGGSAQEIADLCAETWPEGKPMHDRRANELGRLFVHLEGTPAGRPVSLERSAHS